MNFYEVSPVGIVGKDFKVLTYSFSDILPIGTIVEIPVGSRKFVGVVLKKVTRPNFEFKEISRILYNQPLPPALLKLHGWLSDFYATHPGTVWQTMLPSGLNKNRRRSVVENTTIYNNRDSNRANFVFNDEQLAAIDQLAKAPPGTAILHGITGSGKTEVYKALAMKAHLAGKSSIILVPEISLTAQLVDEFHHNFENVIVTHSTMTEAERARVWQEILTIEKPIVVIGPRSALFMPVKNLGLIVIDECHEPSYKQEKAPRYNALRAAAKLAGFSSTCHPELVSGSGSNSLKILKQVQDDSCRLILGSATPLIADYYMARKLGRPIARMTKLARAGAKKSAVQIVDLTKRGNISSESKIFSRQLLAAMKRLWRKTNKSYFFITAAARPRLLCAKIVVGWRPVHAVFCRSRCTPINLCCAATSVVITRNRPPNVLIAARPTSFIEASELNASKKKFVDYFPIKVCGDSTVTPRAAKQFRMFSSS